MHKFVPLDGISENILSLKQVATLEVVTENTWMFLQKGWHHSTVASTVASQKNSPQDDCHPGLSVWTLYVLPVPVWVLSRYSTMASSHSSQAN